MNHTTGVVSFSFSQFTIADAMFAPIAIRPHKIDYLMKDVEAEYMDTLQRWEVGVRMC